MPVFFKGLDKTDILVLVLGFFVTIKIRIIGMFSVSELILMAMLIFRRYYKYKNNIYVKNLRRYAILWMIGIIISNYYNNVSQLDFLKGVFFIIVLIIVIPPIYGLLYDKPERLVLFFLGYGFGQLLAPYTTNDVNLSEALSAEVYKYYAYLYAISGISYFLYLKGKQTISVFIRYGVSVLGLFYMARNPFLTATIALSILLFTKKSNSYNLAYSIKIYKRKMPQLFFFMTIVMLGASFLYESLASNGTLGVKAQEKYYNQKLSGDNILEGGRRETFMGIQLIKENPIWGYGSYAKDKNDEFHVRYAKEHDLEYVWTGNQDRFLPGHSHIVGTWVQNGILGGLFWVFVLLMCWKVFTSGCLMCEPRMLCLLMFQLCAFLWDLLFSPFGDRTFTMFFVITLFIIYDHFKKGNYKTGIVKHLNI